MANVLIEILFWISVPILWLVSWSWEIFFWALVVAGLMSFLNVVFKVFFGRPDSARITNIPEK